MPTAKVDLALIPKEDYATKKTPSKYSDLIIADRAKGMTYRELAKKYEISIASITYVLHPEKYQAYLEKKKAGKTYYNKKRATNNKRKCRQKKYKIMKEKEQSNED